MTGNADNFTGRVTEMERVERLIVDHLKEEFGPNVRIELSPDDPDKFDIAGSLQTVLVNFSGSVMTDGRASLSGAVRFGLVCLTRELRGAHGAYRLVEDVEQAMAGAYLAGAEEFAVNRTVFEGQSGGLWRTVVEVETSIVRGRVSSQPKPFISQFEGTDA